ncbi:YfbK domain-containing protein [Chitinophaga solisilvae]|uniref:YfbK domain-containing protein n=1 Tax=Chitinophaga solisilvae TaxID=1233460 RepID=UPI001369B923|nr:von Willebrand factor type A domain-containing protein [Chitinophaga solisilvae]
MKKYLSLFLLSCLLAIDASAQLRPVSGTVKDKDGNTGIYNTVVRVKGTDYMTATDKQGNFTLKVPAGAIILEAIATSYKRAEVAVSPKQGTVHFRLELLPAAKRARVALQGSEARVRMAEKTYVKGVMAAKADHSGYIMPAPTPGLYIQPAASTEDYSPINENIFHAATDQPLSTFSVDVDRASYSNVRRFLNNGQLPPPDAVRVEEMINYFDYKYKGPSGQDPVAIYADMAICPWNIQHQLVRIALKGKQVDARELPPSNLVFLVDVSGSMESANKLPLVKRAFAALVQQLRPQDKVSVVVYAGAAGVVLPSTSGNEKTKILEAIENLQAGGSTAGGAGIQLAYKIAAENMSKHSNNRVILATDGDFNVGPSSDGELQRIIETEKKKGIFLSVLGFGMGNYKDNKLELLADKGNGNYAYIDNFEEARRTFVTEFGGTLFTIAKDVKLQIEFNPKFVQSYRLVGYENRMLQNEDFNNDQKDAGDMGVGHTVTALYEIVPVGGKIPAVNWVDPLKYQQTAITGNVTEVLTVKLRYKQPDEEKSKLLQKVLPYGSRTIQEAPEDFRMAAAAAAFGQLLRNSAFKGTATWKDVLELAGKSRGDDPEGYRAEFVQLVKKASLLDRDQDKDNE